MSQILCHCSLMPQLQHIIMSSQSYAASLTLIIARISAPSCSSQPVRPSSPEFSTHGCRSQPVHTSSPGFSTRGCRSQPTRPSSPEVSTRGCRSQPTHTSSPDPEGSVSSVAPSGSRSQPFNARHSSVGADCTQPELTSYFQHHPTTNLEPSNGVLRLRNIRQTPLHTVGHHT